jgi:ATP-dependent exoDNAse (exonuclease V) alpha subunit
VRRNRSASSETGTSQAHLKFYSNRKEMIAGIAADIVDAIHRGVNVIAPQRAKNDVRFVNSAVFDALGFAGSGLKFKLIDGERELANGVRVVFKKNALRSPFREEKDQLIHFVHRSNADNANGVLNGYTGTITGVSKRSVTVDLDNGDTIRFDPHEYPHVDYGWAATAHVYQGSKSPLVVQGIGKAEDAHSFHTAATRCVDGLHQHSMLSPEELVDRLIGKPILSGAARCDAVPADRRRHRRPGHPLGKTR